MPGDPIPKVRSKGPLLSHDELKALEGVYGGDPAQATYFAGKLINVALGGRNVSVLPDNRLKIGRTIYKQIARGLFEDKDGDRVAFAVTPAGVFMGDSFLTAQRRSPWYADPVTTLLPLIALPLLMFGGLAFLRARDRRLTLAGLFYAAGGLLLLIALWLEAQYGNEFLRTRSLARAAGLACAAESPGARLYRAARSGSACSSGKATSKRAGRRVSSPSCCASRGS